MESAVGHLVVYEAVDHAPTYQPCEDLADAVSLVETLRNERGLENVQILRTEEICFDFRPYYRVQLGDALAPGSSQPAALPVQSHTVPAAPATAPSPLPSMVAAPVHQSDHTDDAYDADDALVDDDEDQEVGSGIRRGLFGR